MQRLLEQLLSGSPSIRRLGLADNGLSDELLPAFGRSNIQASQLTELDLSKNPLRSSAVDALVQLVAYTQQLKVLKYVWCHDALSMDGAAERSLTCSSPPGFEPRA